MKRKYLGIVALALMAFSCEQRQMNNQKPADQEDQNFEERRQQMQQQQKSQGGCCQADKVEPAKQTASASVEVKADKPL